ncbi:MAG: hypothetical protein UC390_00610 [Peptococcaceae bacterium]|nr:hypothetical protein [Peptococcaceae bacterium]
MFANGGKRLLFVFVGDMDDAGRLQEGVSGRMAGCIKNGVKLISSKLSLNLRMLRWFSWCCNVSFMAINPFVFL